MNGTVTREDASEALKEIYRNYVERNGKNTYIKLIDLFNALYDADAITAKCIDIMRDFPAADVRSVVTCGKCKYGKYTGTEWFCDKHSGHADKFGEDASYHEYHSKHWFCADGERRSE